MNCDVQCVSVALNVSRASVHNCSVKTITIELDSFASDAGWSNCWSSTEPLWHSRSGTCCAVQHERYG
eukprot:SAG31_NODE_743_length_12418_cov_3.780908_16_plen_68_part_00